MRYTIDDLYTFKIFWSIHKNEEWRNFFYSIPHNQLQVLILKYFEKILKTRNPHFLNWKTIIYNKTKKHYRFSRPYKMVCRVLVVWSKDTVTRDTNFRLKLNWLRLLATLTIYTRFFMNTNTSTENYYIL